MGKKKQLLGEQNVRRFMKLSGQGEVLTENFVERLTEMPGLAGEHEEELPPEGGELEPELDLAPEGGADEEVVKDLVDAIADAISAETGIDVSVTGDEDALDELPPEDGMEGELEGELEGDLDVPTEDDVHLRETKDEIDEDLEAANVEVEEESDEDALVAEIARRVARRLLRESAKK